MIKLLTAEALILLLNLYKIKISHYLKIVILQNTIK